MANTCCFRLQLLELRNLKMHKGAPPCPQVQVTCFNQVFSTKVSPSGHNTDLSEVFTFPDIPLSTDFLSTAQCNLVLYHIRDRARTRLGEYSLPLTFVFEAEKHRVTRKWCALVGSLDHIAGFLRISAGLLSPAEVSAISQERMLEAEDDDSDILGMPENLVQQYQLTVGAHKAESLPQYGVRNSISAFVSVTVGNKTVRSRVVQDDAWPQWRDRLLLPTQQPTTHRSIVIQLLAIGRNRSDDELDSFSIDLAQVYSARIPPSWFHIYTGKHKEVYAGRLLLSLALDPSNDPATGVEAGNAAEEPELSLYQLWLCVPEVAGLDFKGKLKVRFECGGFAMDSQYEETVNRRWLWRDKANFPQTTLELPSNPAQIPKLLLKIVTNSIEEREISVAMLELDSAALIAAGSYQTPPVWRRLISLIDPRVPETKRNLTGSILVSANLMKSVRHSRKEYTDVKVSPSEVWVNIYLVRELPLIYKCPLKEVFIQVSVCGVTKLTTSIKDTDNPHWNQLLKWRLHLPHDPDSFWVDLWETRPWPDHNSLIGSARIPPEEFEPALVSAPRTPLPRVYPLMAGAATVGKVLVGVAVYPLASKDQKVGSVADAQQGEVRKASLQVLVVGTRKLRSFGPRVSFKPIVRASVGAETPQETEISDRKFDTSDNNHNIVQTLEFPLLLSKLPERAPSLTLRIYENRAYTRSLIGTTEVALSNYLPWVPRTSPIVAEEHLQVSESASEHESEHSEDKPDPEPESVKDTDPYDGFFVDIRDGRKLNFTIDRSLIEVTDTMEALTADRDLVPKEPKLWPGYIPENFTRPILTGPLEQSVPLNPFYETFPLYQYPRVPSGYLKCLIRVLEQRGAAAVSLEPLKREVTSSVNLVVRLYCLTVENVKGFPEDAKVIVWCKTSEGDEKFRVQVEVVRMPNGSIELMTMVKVPVTLPDHAYLKICLLVQEGESRWMLGSTEIDIEQRWFAMDFQELRNPDLRKVPIEMRKLETGDELVSSGELVMWMDILTVEEANKHQPEKLISSVPSPFILRIVIWSVYDLSLPPRNLQVAISLQNGASVLSQHTDIHTNAESRAEFNWRCVFSIGLPDESNFFTVNLSHIPSKGLRDSLGDATVDLSAFYLEVLKRDEIGRLQRAAFPLSDRSQELVARIDLEVALLSIDEAEENPAGEGRAEPNKDPFLPFPEGGRDHEAVEVEIVRGKAQGRTTVKRLKGVLVAAVCLILVISVPLVLLSVGVL